MPKYEEITFDEKVKFLLTAIWRLDGLLTADVNIINNWEDEIGIMYTAAAAVVQDLKSRGKW